MEEMAADPDSGEASTCMSRLLRPLPLLPLPIDPSPPEPDPDPVLESEDDSLLGDENGLEDLPDRTGELGRPLSVWWRR